MKVKMTKPVLEVVTAPWTKEGLLPSSKKLCLGSRWLDGNSPDELGAVNPELELQRPSRPAPTQGASRRSRESRVTFIHSPLALSLSEQVKGGPVRFIRAGEMSGGSRAELQDMETY